MAQQSGLRLPPFRLALAALAAACAGCQSMSPEERIWQSLHAVDVAQTLNAADDRCYKEDAWLTQRLIGSQPSDGEVVAWGVGMAAAHAWVSHALEVRDAPMWLQMVWDFGTLGHTAYAIGSNYHNGVRITGDNVPVPGCS